VNRACQWSVSGNRSGAGRKPTSAERSGVQKIKEREHSGMSLERERSGQNLPLKIRSTIKPLKVKKRF